MQYGKTTEVVFGSYLHDDASRLPPVFDKAIVHFPGCTELSDKGFSLNDDVLSRHVLLLGGSGCGKTNAMCHAMETLRSSMTADDVAIFFDTKGEFYEWFARPGDIVIGNSKKFRGISHTWNIYDEILADGTEPEDIQQNCREISAALFHGRGSETQPFFCNAARDIFAGVLYYFVRKKLDEDKENAKKPAKDRVLRYNGALNNHALVGCLRKYTVQNYRTIAKAYPELKYLLTYIGDETPGAAKQTALSNQALSVFAELNSMVAEYFTGLLSQHKENKSVSMRNFVRNRGGKAVFIEYDIALGETMGPVYRVLVDQAMKEALSSSATEKKDEGRSKRARVYFFADELKLLPKMQHIDDALNFGRGMGVRVLAGIQSIDQLYDVYGENKGKVLASGFGTMFAFHTNDASSRTYIADRFGPNYTVTRYPDPFGGAPEILKREGKVADEWEQVELECGQAIIAIGDKKPFLFQFAEWIEPEKRIRR